jgi:hypothetical protein
MSNIVAFLQARLDEEEVDHCSAKWSESKLHRSGCDTNTDSYPASCDCDGPTLILALSASIRAIIERHRPAWAADWPCCAVCHDGNWSNLDGASFPCDTVRLLAQVHAGHPDFDDAWRLDA